MKAKNIKLNYEAMKSICLAEVEQFSLIDGAVTSDTKHGPLIYIDRGSDILGVAHLDSVQETKHFYHLLIGDEDIIMNAQLDDRLGVYILLSLLPSLGVNTDILLTWGEEKGQSTAEFFQTKKKYKWMYEPDRMGDDCVHYQFGEEKFKKALTTAGFTGIQYGMKSDICYLEHLGCRGFNFGIGYKNYHDKRAEADMHIVRAQVARFLNFYKQNKNRTFKYEKPKPTEPYVWNPTPPAVRFDSTIKDFHLTHKWDQDLHGWVPIRTTQPTITRMDQEKYRKGEIVVNSQGEICTTHKLSNRNIILGDMCEICNKGLILAVDCDSKYYGVCVSCEYKVDRCIACDEIELRKNLDFEDMCPDCANKARINPDMRTSIECKKCSYKLSLKELRNGDVCEMCLTYPGNWWEDGYDWSAAQDKDFEDEESNPFDSPKEIEEDDDPPL